MYPAIYCYPIEINSTQEFAILLNQETNRNQNENGIDE